jgi:hypothetical protein
MLDQPLPAQHLDWVLAFVDDANPAQTHSQADKYVQPRLYSFLPIVGSQ